MLGPSAARRPLVRLHLRAVIPAVVLTGLLAGCNAGDITSTATPKPTPTAASASTTVTIPTNDSVVFPAAAGSIVTLQFGTGAPASTTLTATVSGAAPTGAPAPSAYRRKAAAISGATAFYFVTMAVSADVPLSAFAGEAISLNGQPTSASYYTEFDDITSASATKLMSCGPATVGGTIVQISSSTCTATSAPQTLVTGHQYLLQFYYVAS
jgi:hypothetical protein